MPRISEAKRAAILQDYIAGKLTIVAICRKHDVSDDQPRVLARAAGVERRAGPGRAGPPRKPRAKTIVVLTHRPPKIAAEEWAARCARRAHYIATVGFYPDRVVGRSIDVHQMAALEGTFSPHPPGSRILAVMKARERSDYVARQS